MKNKLNEWMIDQIVPTIKAVIIAANAKCSTLMNGIIEMKEWKIDMNDQSDGK